MGEGYTCDLCLVLDFVGLYRQEFRFDQLLQVMTGRPTWLRLAFRRIVERNHRVLTVVYNPSVHPVRVITVYFDRRLRGRS